MDFPVERAGSVEMHQLVLLACGYVFKMPNPTFKCPFTGRTCPGPFEPDPDTDPSMYELVVCPACGLAHLLNKATGRLLSETVKTPSSPS